MKMDKYWNRITVEYLRKNKKPQLTLAIRNAGKSADMKVNTFNKHFCWRTVKCIEIPHYA